MDLNGAQARELAIISLNGEVVLASGAVTAETMTLDVSALKPASYFLLITDRDGRVSSKPFTKL